MRVMKDIVPDMVHHHHRADLQQLRKGEAEQQLKKLLGFSSSEHSADHLPSYYVDLCSNNNNKKTAKPTLLRLFILFFFICCSLVFAPSLTFGPFPFLYSIGAEEKAELLQISSAGATDCSATGNNTICCDRSSFRTDVCYMRGDIRTHPSSNSILLRLPSTNSNSTVEVEEKIKPYTRKWEASVMATIDELRLRSFSSQGENHSACDVRHEVPAVVLSTGGYTGNLYHEFNDGILPLYITAQKFNRRVVFVLLEYHDWWITKYGEVLSRLSDYPPIDFSNDKRTHCFPEAIVGLRIHDELTVDPSRMEDNKTVVDFRELLEEAYKPRVRWIEKEEINKVTINEQKQEHGPKLVILARNGSRAIENELEVVRVAEEVGFSVKVLRPGRTTELVKIYKALNSCDAMVGVHGAAMTHFMFMRPGKVFIQVVPLGTDWAADAYYGAPARKMGLKYIPYKILPRESSLYSEYASSDPVLSDPDSVNAKGWEFTKKVYLDGQNVKLDIARFKKRLQRAHEYFVNHHQHQQQRVEESRR